jgi:hypothetical protein
MAILNQNSSTGNAGGSRAKNVGTPPKGTFLAVCLGSDEEYGVTRKKFESEETETVDLISFYFGYKLKTGEPFVIRSKRMKLSGHEKSALFQFIAGWLGEKPPANFDTATLEGKAAQITVAHEIAISSGKTYANLKSASPVIEGMESAIPEMRIFSELLEPQAGSSLGEDEDKIPF